MAHPRLIPPSKRNLFLLLMGISALMLAMPTQYIHRPASEMAQVLALPQWAVHRAVLSATRPLKDLAREQITAEQQARLEETAKALENENVVLRQQVESLKQTVDELTLLRQNGLPGDGMIIQAEVIAGDAAPHQDSFLVGKGRSRGVKYKDWVASRLFVRAGVQDSVRDEAAVLARQCLIGWVEQAATFTSRVVLLSDPIANRGVLTHIAHYDRETGQPRQVLLDGQLAPFVLRGAGDGKMIIRDIKDDFIKAGVIAKGDLVLSDPHDPKLAQSLVIGEIEELRHNKDQPLLYDAIVHHRFDPQSLGQVLIVDRSRTAGAP